MLDLVISLINAIVAIISLITALINITKETSFLQNKKERGITTNKYFVLNKHFNKINTKQVIIIKK